MRVFDCCEFLPNLFIFFLQFGFAFDMIVDLFVLVLYDGDKALDFGLELFILRIDIHDHLFKSYIRRRLLCCTSDMRSSLLTIYEFCFASISFSAIWLTEAFLELNYFGALSSYSSLEEIGTRSFAVLIFLFIRFIDPMIYA